MSTSFSYNTLIFVFLAVLKRYYNKSSSKKLTIFSNYQKLQIEYKYFCFKLGFSVNIVPTKSSGSLKTIKRIFIKHYNKFYLCTYVHKIYYVPFIE